MKNKINIFQLREDQLSGYTIQVSSGYIGNYVSGVSGDLDDKIEATGQFLLDRIEVIESSGVSGGSGGGAIGFRVSLASGVDTVHCAYGTSYGSVPKVVSQVGTSGASDPIVLGMLTASNITGSKVELSDLTSSSNYYLDFILSV